MAAGLSFRDVDGLFAFTAQVFAEVVHKTPVEVFVHVAEAMSLVREHEHVEALSCLYESVDHSCGVARMDIVVNVSVHEKKMSLES